MHLKQLSALSVVALLAIPVETQPASAGSREAAIAAGIIGAAIGAGVVLHGHRIRHKSAKSRRDGNSSEARNTKDPFAAAAAPADYAKPVSNTR